MLVASVQLKRVISYLTLSHRMRIRAHTSPIYMYLTGVASGGGGGGGGGNGDARLGCPEVKDVCTCVPETYLHVCIHM